MGDIIRKVITNEVKEVSDRVLQLIGSTEKQDRDGEVIKADGWDLKQYKKNPVIMWAHRYDQPPIGKALNVKVIDGKLTFKVEFADAETYEFADTIYKLFKGGFLNATSVGFVPLEWEDGDGEKNPKRIYTKQELLELSAVPVPSNPEALVTAREQGLITVKEFDFITKQKYQCECIACGYKLESEEHCRDIKCPECGGEMRRLERPGVGQEGAEGTTKPEETENYIRIPVPGEEDKHKEHKIRWITVSEPKGIRGIYCIDCKKIITYVFDKDKWSMEEAQRWVDEHKAFSLIQLGIDELNSSDDIESVNVDIKFKDNDAYSPNMLDIYSVTACDADDSTCIYSKTGTFSASSPPDNYILIPTKPTGSQYDGGDLNGTVTIGDYPITNAPPDGPLLKVKLKTKSII